MSQTGPKPTPLNMRLIQGNPNNRPIDDNIPDPEVLGAIPVMPEYLSLAACEHWPEFATQLSNMRVLTNADLPALCMLCETYAIYWEAMNGVREFGMISMTPNHHLQESAYLNTAFRALDKCMKILTEFGLTPSSRMRVRK